ncbi:Ig-like domain-containing protein [Pseudomonas protegens]
MSEGWVSQDIALPKDPGVDAVYSLSLLWQGRYNQTGWVYIFQGAQECHKIELKPADTADNEHVMAASGVKQKTTLIPFELELSSTLSSKEPLRIEIRSEKNESMFAELWITRVRIELQLAPLELQEIILDGESQAPSRKIYLCQGATSGGGDDALITAHTLGFIPVPDHAWDGTPVALTLDNNPLEAIVARPDWGTHQSLELQWTFDCPYIDNSEHEFTLSVINRYTAQACLIAVSLGHHRLIFREVLEAAYYPLIGQSVRLGVQVASYYTGQPLAGRTVNWSIAGQGVLGATITDEFGWAWFNYEAKTAGDFAIEAAVVSPYYAQGVWTEAFEVRVLGADPWAGLTVFENNEVKGWIENGYPNRGSTYSIMVMLPVDSPLRGSYFYLHSRGDKPEQIGVIVSPALETPVPVANSTWTLTCEDRRDGVFELSLVCSKLLLPSPGKRMSLARNRIRVSEVRQANNRPVVEDQESAFLRLQVVHVTDQGDGEAVIGAQVEWQTAYGISHSQTGSGGWASLAFQPKDPGTHDITAEVRAHEAVAPIVCKFTVTAIASSSWKDKVSITFDNDPVNSTLGAFCKRGQLHTLAVMALPESPLIGQRITLSRGVDDPDIGLLVSDLDMPRRLLADEPLTWTLSSEFTDSRSSMFQLRLLNDELEDRELLGRLSSPDIHDEFTLVLDQMVPLRGQSLYPCLGAVHHYIFRTHEQSPFIGTSMDLDWSGSSAEALGIVLIPPPGSHNVIDESGMTWTLNCSASKVSGDFRLRFNTPLGTTDFTSMHLGHNKLSLETVRESAVFPVVGQEPARMWVKVHSDFTEDAVGQVPALWTVDGKTEPYETADDGWSGFAYAPTTDGTKTVNAAVVSPYDNNTQSHSFEVCALNSDPLAELLLSIDRQPAQPFGQKTCFPRRGLTHRVDITAPSDSVLIGRKLTVGMVGAGPSALGIRFHPSVLGLPRVFSEAGFTDYFTVDDVADGSCGLFVACDKLAEWSPVNAMSVGEGSQVVKIAERSRGSQALLWGEAVSEQITIISAISGRPMAGMKVVWRNADLGEVTTLTNFYGVTRIHFVPKTPGAAQLTATVGGALHSESMSIPFYLNEPRQILSLTSPKPNGSPGDQVSAIVNVVSALTCMPLEGVEVLWKYPGLNLQPTTTDVEGNARIEFRLPGVRRGWLDASLPGGYRGWEFKTLKFEVVPKNV